MSRLVCWYRLELCLDELSEICGIVSKRTGRVGVGASVAITRLWNYGRGAPVCGIGRYSRVAGFCFQRDRAVVGPCRRR